ncbi:MAG: Archaeal ATPase [Clostridia bacterium]
MKLCDFCSVAKLILSFVGESKNISQMDLMYDLFKDFIESDEGYDFEFDNGLVCRWLNGTAKISPRITAYYATNGNIEAMAIDIEEYILPLFYDKAMAVTSVYELLMNDSTVSERKKCEIAEGYPYNDDTEISDFLSRVLLFGMDRPFIKRDTKTKNLISTGALSPIVQEYIYDIVPKPCKHFCGRENELEMLHSVLDNNIKVFVQGVPGIGKSEFAKKYAQLYKKEYTNILYFNYRGDLKQMIIDCDFADDALNENDDMRFKRHNRFLRGLKEDTLIIIDNFNTIASAEPLFDVIMKYRCKILFTTRSSFSDYTCFELKEIEDMDTLLSLVGYFYESETDSEIIKQIIYEVHRHTLSVELAARLLASGILESDRLLKELNNTKSILHTEDKINLVKDGTSSKATYYEHIHKLVSLFGLTAQAIDIMRNMTLVPYDGILPRLFVKWISLDNLNTVNELIEYGFIQMNDYRKIALHPLIQEVAIDDTKPSIVSCAVLLSTLRELCLMHGLDLPYHNVMFKIIENTVLIADKDDMNAYLLFLKDTFPYMEKYAYRHGMELIISEFKKLIKDFHYGAVEKAMLLDYKAAYEHICNQNHKKALQYEQQAIKYCDEIVNTNPHLAANIYGNIGGLYHSTGQTEKAKTYMEQAYHILEENNLQFTNDSVIQMCNYANLAANMGEPCRAVKALEACAKAVREYNSDNSSDYANLLWDIGCIYMQLRDRDNALAYFKTALKIYNDLWKNEPDLLRMKLSELKKLATVYGMNTLPLIQP